MESVDVEVEVHARQLVCSNYRCCYGSLQLLSQSAIGIFDIVVDEYDPATVTTESLFTMFVAQGLDLLDHEAVVGLRTPFEELPLLCMKVWPPLRRRSYVHVCCFKVVFNGTRVEGVLDLTLALTLSYACKYRSSFAELHSRPDSIIVGRAGIGATKPRTEDGEPYSESVGGTQYGNDCTVLYACTTEPTAGRPHMSNNEQVNHGSASFS